MKDERLDLYKRLLLTWNEKINLIGPAARANLDDHIAEALAAAEIVKPTGEVLDFGSGGGLPAIPMAIVSPGHFHLVEADKKKWAFLKRAVRELGLNAAVYGDRLARVLTQLPPDLRFTLVTSRAVGNPERWLPSLAPWMESGGRAALFRGASDAPRISHFRKQAAYELPRGFLVTFHVEQQ
jgi:16S rRNA (guanine527-N7)-methyltransferase